MYRWHNRLADGLKNLVHFSKLVIKDFSDDNGGLVAAAVSYYTFLSIIPILLLAVAIIGFILKSPEHARSMVLYYYNQYSPSLTEKGSIGAADIVAGIVNGREAATGIGLIALLWTGTSAMTIIEQAINLAWNVEQKRNYIKRRLLSVVMMLSLGVLLSMSFGVTAFFTAMVSSDKKVFGISPANIPFLWAFVSFLVPFIVTIVTFTLVYKILPNIFVPFRVALVGAVFSGALWEMAKYLFSYYVVHFAHYSQIYGSLGAIILLLVWINYSSYVTILGAEVASVYAHRRSDRLESNHA